MAVAALVLLPASLQADPDPAEFLESVFGRPDSQNWWQRWPEDEPWYPQFKAHPERYCPLLSRELDVQRLLRPERLETGKRFGRPAGEAAAGRFREAVWLTIIFCDEKQRDALVGIFQSVIAEAQKLEPRATPRNRPSFIAHRRLLDASRQIVAAFEKANDGRLRDVLLNQFETSNNADQLGFLRYFRKVLPGDPIVRARFRKWSDNPDWHLREQPVVKEILEEPATAR